MLQAIKTTYYPSTNHRAARVRVRAQAGTDWFYYDPGLSPQKNHEQCAAAFANKREWLEDHKLVGGMLDANSYCWVMIEK